MNSIKINGKLISFDKAPVVNFIDDGIQRIKKNNILFGPKLGVLGNRSVVIGKEMVYLKTEDKGIKIYYSKAKDVSLSIERIKKKYKTMKRYFNNGYRKNVYEIIKVKLDFCNALGIVVDHVNLPDEWSLFLRGKQYDWNCIKHKNHSINGYNQFVSTLPVPNIKFGDVGWDTIDNRWYLMDVSD